MVFLLFVTTAVALNILLMYAFSHLGDSARYTVARKTLFSPSLILVLVGVAAFLAASMLTPASNTDATDGFLAFVQARPGVSVLLAFEMLGAVSFAVYAVQLVILLTHFPGLIVSRLLFRRSIDMIEAGDEPTKHRYRVIVAAGMVLSLFAIFPAFMKLFIVVASNEYSGF